MASHAGVVRNIILNPTAASFSFRKHCAGNFDYALCCYTFGRLRFAERDWLTNGSFCKIVERTSSSKTVTNYYFWRMNMGQAILSEKEILKLPFSQTTFSEMRKNGRIYIDKTDMIGSLAKLDAAPVFLSRPRRFGKSLLLSTFESLFSRGLKDFENLKIIKNDLDSDDRFWHNEKTYKVIHLDFSRIALKDADDFESFLTIRFHLELRGKNAWELTEAEKSVSYNDLLDSYSKENRGKDLVLLIDEYDSPITHSVDNPQKMKEMMDAVSSFFATIKSCEGMFRFVCITGVTRLAHVSLFSMFNSLADITVNDKYSALLGITEDELHEYFDTYVQNAAAVLDMNVSDVYARLKSTYNGFQFAINAQQTVYNPWSLFSFFSEPEFGFLNYWYSTSGGVPTMLVKYLQQNVNLELFSMLRDKVSNPDGERISVNRDTLLAKSEPDQIPMHLLLYQAGCFTLKQTGKHRAKLVIPNDEIAESMIQLSLDMQNLKPSDETCDRVSSDGFRRWMSRDSLIRDSATSSFGITSFAHSTPRGFSVRQPD